MTLKDPLDEALGLYKEIGHELVQVAADLIDPFEAIVDAARRVAEAPKWTICEVHNSRILDWSVCETAARMASRRQYPTPCRMVRKLLVDP